MNPNDRPARSQRRYGSPSRVICGQQHQGRLVSEVLIRRLRIQREDGFGPSRIDCLQLPLNEIQNRNLFPQEGRNDLRVHPELLVLLPSDFKQMGDVPSIESLVSHDALPVCGEMIGHSRAHNP